MAPPRVDIELRFHQRYTIDRATGCWLWDTTTPTGYGTELWSGKNRYLPHRFAYQLYVGPIPEGLVIDHICHDPTDCREGPLCPHRRCVNPDHLKAVTPGENSRRQLNGIKTHCTRGHEFTPENTRTYRGSRHCRACASTYRSRRAA